MPKLLPINLCTMLIYLRVSMPAFLCVCSYRVMVRRYDGELDMPVTVSYATKDGTAIAGIDYKAEKVGSLRWLF